MIRMIGGAMAGVAIMCTAYVGGLISHYGATANGFPVHESGTPTILMGILMAALAALFLSAPRS